MATVLHRRVASSWTQPLVALALALAGLLVLFARDVGDMAALWWEASTYQHCLFVLPIVAWLIWQRRVEVAVQRAAGWWPGLALVGLAAFVWLAGEAGGVALVRHAALVLMVQATVVTVLGPAVARALLFPLFYVVFLVPFGDEFVGPMQVLTARMTMALLHFTGIPATLDGVFITIPKGWFEVAEECAGVKFLIAMVAYGALVAHVGFRSWRRRALFMLAAVVVPVLANAVRAWGTIFAAHLTSVELATGFDHIVYGWVFFAVVMIVIVGGAWRFFDRRLGDDWLGGRVFAVWRPVAPALLVAPLAVGIAALAPVWDMHAASVGRVALPNRVELPLVAGWARSGEVPRIAWVPRFDGADHRLLGRYGSASGQSVDVAVALYAWQDQGRAVVAYAQGAADPAGPWKWASDLPSVAGAKTERLLGPGKVARVAATWWIIGGEVLSSKPRAKLVALARRLTGGDQSAATLIVSSEDAGAVAAFARDMGPPAALVTRLLAEAKAR